MKTEYTKKDNSEDDNSSDDNKSSSDDEEGKKSTTNSKSIVFSALKTGFSAVRFLRRSPMLKIPFYVGIVMQKILF